MFVNSSATPSPPPLPPAETAARQRPNSGTRVSRYYLPQVTGDIKFAACLSVCLSVCVDRHKNVRRSDLHLCPKFQLNPFSSYGGTDRQTDKHIFHCMLPPVYNCRKHNVLDLFVRPSARLFVTKLITAIF